MRSTPKAVSVTAEVSTITEQISNETLHTVYSVMADTTVLNTGKNPK